MSDMNAYIKCQSKIQWNFVSGDVLGTIRHQDIIWVNVDPVLSKHMVPLAHNELMILVLKNDYDIKCLGALPWKKFVQFSVTAVHHYSQNWHAYHPDGQIDFYPDSKVHGAHLGPIWGRQDPCWPHELCYLGSTAGNRLLYHCGNGACQCAAA